MGSEGPSIVGIETEDEKKRKAQRESNSATGNISKIITKELLDDFLRSEEFRLKKDVAGDFGFLPMPDDQISWNLAYFPENKGQYKSILISLLPPTDAKDKDPKPKHKILQAQTSGEDEGSLTMMIFTLAETLRKFNPNSMEVILKPNPNNPNAKKIMEEACKKYGLKVVETFSSEKKDPTSGATLKLDKPDSNDAPRPRIAGK